MSNIKTVKRTIPAKTIPAKEIIEYLDETGFRHSSEIAAIKANEEYERQKKIKSYYNKVDIVLCDDGIGDDITFIKLTIHENVKEVLASFPYYFNSTYKKIKEPGVYYLINFVESYDNYYGAKMEYTILTEKEMDSFLETFGYIQKNK